MPKHTVLRRTALAAALALSLAGVDAGAGAAEAMPVAAAPAVGTGLTTVQYYGYRHGYRRHGRRHAGLYNCGRGALRTHLERKACGFAPRGHNGPYRFR